MSSKAAFVKPETRVRITAQLIDAETGGHIWADRYDRVLDDIFAVQDDITNNIVGSRTALHIFSFGKRIVHILRGSSKQ